MTDKGYEEFKDLLEKYKEDVLLTYQNIEQKSFLAPTIKVKWVGEYHGYKRNLKNAKDKLAKLRADEQLVVGHKLKIDLKDSEISKLKLKASVEIKVLEDRVEDLVDILDFLDDCRSLVRFYNNDVTNAINAIKLDA